LAASTVQYKLCRTLIGNGRVGRLLITFLLCENNALQKPVLYLSHYFRRHRTLYYDSLQKIRDSGDWEQWLTFFLMGVEGVSRDATLVARDILALRERHRGLITDGFGRAAANGHRILEYMYRHPMISVRQIQDRTNTTYQAANQLVSRFVETGILTEYTGQARNRAFRYGEYIDLFGERH
jgi:Fic family protein